MLTIHRTGESFRVQRGEQGRFYEGLRSFVTVGGFSCHAIERGDGFVRLPNGLYLARMATWTSRRSGSTARSIVFAGCLDGPMLTAKQQQELEEEDIHMHPANWPWQLEGCVAPGISTSRNGVVRSGEALGLIFNMLGGYENGRTLEVRIK